MRIFAAILLFAAVPLHLLSGAGAILQAKAETFLAKEAQMAKSGDLSAVAGDLVDEETLKKQQVAKKPAAVESSATRLWVFGIVLIVLGLCQLVAGVQVMRDRIGATVLLIVLLALLARAAGLVLDGPSIIGAGQAALMALALVFVWFARVKACPCDHLKSRLKRVRGAYFGSPGHCWLVLTYVPDYPSRRRLENLDHPTPWQPALGAVFLPTAGGCGTQIDHGNSIWQRASGETESLGQRGAALSAPARLKELQN